MPRFTPSGSSVRRRCALALLAAVLAAEAHAGKVEVVSRLDPGFASDTPGSYSLTYRAPSTVSADGRFAVFTSRANNVIDGQVDENNSDEVFLYDRQTGTLALVSHALGTSTAAASSGGSSPVISADGRFIAYLSYSTNLIAGHVERNGSLDVFLYDRLTDTHTLVSRTPASATTTGNGGCSRPQVSDDGAAVVYSSTATDLVSGQTDTSGTDDVFLYDRAAGTNTLLSRVAGTAASTGNAYSNTPAVSGDGAWAAFTSRASNLLPLTDANNAEDVFLYERATGALTLVSHTAASATTAGSAAANGVLLGQDGAWAAFVSRANNHVAGQVDTNSNTDVFFYERATGTISLVSHIATSAVQAAPYAAWGPSISADARWIAYSTTASNAVAGQTDSNAATDVFLQDRTTGTSVLVSHVPASATTTGNGNADSAAISRDGSRVTFYGTASNLVSGQTDTNMGADVYVFDRASGTVALASHNGSTPTTTGSSTSWDPVIAGDGSMVLFYSSATDLVSGVKDKNKAADVYRFDPPTGATALVSRRAPTLPALTPSGTSALAQTGERAASADGRWIAFASDATDLVPGQVDANSGQDIFLYDRATRTTLLVSHVAASAVTTPNSSSYDPAVSADGRFVVFASDATNVVASQSGDFPFTTDVFLYDRQGGTITLVSHQPASATTPAWCCSDWPAISADGATVVYRSDSPNLVAGQSDTNNSYNLFLWDRATNGNLLISHASGAAATASNGRSWPFALSADGAWVAYSSSATNLMPAFTDGNGVQSDVFLWERATDATTLVSAAAGLPTTGGNSYPGGFLSISGDGRYVAHDSSASNLVAGQSGGSANVFVYDRVAGVNAMVSHAAAAATQGGNSFSNTPRISEDGNWIVFQTLATDLVSGITDTNTAYDVYVYQRSTGANTLVSHSSALARTTTANKASDFPEVSADGRTIAFRTAATNVISGNDSNGNTDVIFYDRATRTAYFASRANFSTFYAANDRSGLPLRIANGDAVIFPSIATNLISYDFNGLQDLYLYSHKPVADLAIAKTDGMATVTPGQTLTWTITVTNLGPEAASGATVTDTFPAAVTGVLWTCAGSGGATCPASGAGNISHGVTLPAGGSVTYSATGILDPGASGTLSNTAQVTAPASVVDLDGSNNSATDVDTVQ